MKKALNIQNVSVSTNTFYDTFANGVGVVAYVNNHRVEIWLHGVKGHIMHFGADACEAKVDGKLMVFAESGAKYDSVYPMYISDGCIKAKSLKTKDLRFTGRSYSTTPFKTEFKKELRRLYNGGHLTDKFLNALELL